MLRDMQGEHEAQIESLVVPIDAFGCVADIDTQAVDEIACCCGR